MRRPLEEKWDNATVALVGGVPWRVSDDDPKADGEATKLDIPREARQVPDEEKDEMAQIPRQKVRGQSKKRRRGGEKKGWERESVERRKSKG